MTSYIIKHYYQIFLPNLFLTFEPITQIAKDQELKQYGYLPHKIQARQRSCFNTCWIMCGNV